MNAGASLDDKTQAVYTTLWLEGLSDLPVAVLLAAFRRTLMECPYWPVKVCDIRGRVTRAVQNESADAAEKAWARVLEIRRLYWNPDLPADFDRAVSRLTERVQQAARAAGVWRDFESLEALHVWTKKRFCESFAAWGEKEQDEFLLPDGALKNLLVESAETKALPGIAPTEPPALSPEERLRLADELADAARKVLGIRKGYAYPPVNDIAERQDELRRQAELIVARYPTKAGTKTVDERNEAHDYA